MDTKLRNGNDSPALIGAANLASMVWQHRVAALLAVLHLFRLQFDMRAALIALGAGMLFGR